MISANRFSTDVFERAFVYDRDKILEYGYPRNDILYADNKEEIAAEVKKELGIPEGKRVILYAPTCDNQFYDRGKYKFTLALDLGRLQKEFGEDSVVLLRTHYYIADILDLTEYEGFVYNGSQYEDVSRLYLASDICITDYSSVFFDFANLKRPILFYAYDFDEYAVKNTALEAYRTLMNMQMKSEACIWIWRKNFRVRFSAPTMPLSMLCIIWMRLRKLTKSATKNFTRDFAAWMMDMLLSA